MKTKIKSVYDGFPKTKKTPKKNEIWLAYFPYYGRTNIEKLRPVLICSVIDDEAMVRKITTNSKRGVFININGDKKSYLTKHYARIKLYKCYRKLDKYEKN